MNARDRAIAARIDQRMDDAWAAVCDAAVASPDDGQIAFMHAQIAFETGRKSVALFDRAQAMARDDLMLLRNRAGALVEAGKVEASDALLEAALVAQPEWLDGHKALAAMRTTRGGSAGYDASYARACAVQPGSLPLRLAWFHAVALARDWDLAEQILAEGEQLFGSERGLRLSRAYLAGETGGHDPFAAVAEDGDPGIDIAQVRYHLREGRLEVAEAIARRHLGGPAATMFWPYLATIWRMSGDPLYERLNGAGGFVRCYDLDIAPEELAALADDLRALQTARSPYLDQSVRGGTQTGGQLFFHHNPRIQAVRARITDAVRDYIDALPPPDVRHPLLGPKRDAIRFEGSWSVRLTGAGHHVAHTHPMGWISSAFYVALPDAPGEAPAGWIEFGAPPPELGLDMPPVARVEPKPGRLVLFPSTLWHGTVPFADGERLTIAFDVRRGT